MPAHHFRAYNADGVVVEAGLLSETGSADFTAAESIDKVVFYSGDVANEVVFGTVEVDATGALSVAAPTE